MEWIRNKANTMERPWYKHLFYKAGGLRCDALKGGFSLLVPYGLLFSGRYYYFICDVIGIQKAINHIKWEEYNKVDRG